MQMIKCPGKSKQIYIKITGTHPDCLIAWKTCLTPQFSKSRLYAAAAAAAAAKSLQSCPTLCDPTDCSPPGSPSLGFSRQEHLSGLPFPSPMHESKKWKWKWSCVRLLGTPWTAAHQAPLSMGFSRQEYWSGVPLPSPMFDLPPPKTKGSLQMDQLKSFSWTTYCASLSFLINRQPALLLMVSYML